MTFAPKRPLVLTRRGVGRLAMALAAARLPGMALAAEEEAETHGLSAFGDLAMPPDFKRFSYVNPDAPKGGTLVIQLRAAGGNQNFDTFNTLNVHTFKGDGAAGMDATFDTLMSGGGDEPDSLYGLVARAVRVSADKLTYRFLLRPEARFSDGTRLTARDVAFSLMILKTKGHPSERAVLTQFLSAEAEGDDVVAVRLSDKRSRDLHLVVASLPIFSATYWSTRDYEASTLDPPLGSGAYKVGRFEQGRFIEFERVPDYWAKDLPVNVGTNNFDRIRYEYYRDRQVAFEAFKAGKINFNEEYTSRIWATQYDFPAVRDGRVKKEELPSGAPVGSQGWYFNLRRAMFRDPRIREAIGLVFDFEWTNKNIMYSAYKRTTSFFENSDMKAVGKPGPEELALLEPWKGKIPDECFGEPYLPPVSDGSGSDRNLLRQADQLLQQAGCKRDGSLLKLPSGQPFEIEFLDFQAALQPHTEPFQANLKRLGISCRSRIVDAAQYHSRMDQFDFDVASMALGGSRTPGDVLRIVYGSEAATTPGSRNIAGIADPAIDAVIDKIANAKTRAELNIACRVLDRMLRAGRYWVPMWYKNQSLIAYWDIFARPQTQPKYGTGAPDTWWVDPKKAAKVGLNP
ncbi:microcin C transport system substrate-binding protein [Rhizobiales bacterium GAS113]|jgi:microcin C transport system substrate-binding protein|nr:microcin C transport system substrate-binding protein [Rhizobiales bacterium GAS113]SEC18835.1 microcin C transport system substrate-binding protein [Rhizobiales bacterium GAS188]